MPTTTGGRAERRPAAGKAYACRSVRDTFRPGAFSTSRSSWGMDISTV